MKFILLLITNIGCLPRKEVEVEVFYDSPHSAPEVELSLEVVTPLSKDRQDKVMLTCRSKSSVSLERVRWFLDGQVLKELYECDLR